MLGKEIQSSACTVHAWQNAPKRGVFKVTWPV